MKKLIFLVLNLALSFSMLGQTVGASQIKKKTNGGLTGDSANNLAVGIYRGTSAPASPITGQLWADTTTTPALVKIYNGSTWEISPTGSVTVQNDLATLPANPTSGQIVWASNFKRAIVYDETEAAWYYLDGTQRKVFTTYSTEGLYSSAFLTPPGATTGTVTSGGSVTAGTHKCVTTFYNSTGGETLPGTPTGTLTAGSPNQTLSLTIPTGDANTAGRRIYCTKANTASPYFLANTVADNATTTFDVTISDATFTAATPPDTNFSAPLPSGWAVASVGISYGGCGSTGVSLMCSVVRNPLTPNTSTYLGIRLYYDVGAADFDATFRIKRADPGFTSTGATAGGATFFVSMAYAGSDPATASGGYSRALGLYNNASNSLLPPGANSGVWQNFYRNTNTAWATSGVVTDWFRLSVLVPTYFRITSQTSGSNYYGRFELTNDVACSLWTAGWSYLYNVPLNKVGMAIETPQNSSGSTIPAAVYEMDQFNVIYY